MPHLPEGGRWPHDSRPGGDDCRCHGRPAGRRGGPTSDRRTLAGRGSGPGRRATRLRRGGPARRMPRRPAPAARPVRRGPGVPLGHRLHRVRRARDGDGIPGEGDVVLVDERHPWPQHGSRRGRRRQRGPLARLRGLDGLDVGRALAAGDALSVRPGGRGVSRLRDQGLGVPCTSARHRVLGREDSVGATRLTGPWLRTDAVWTVATRAPARWARWRRLASRRAARSACAPRRIHVEHRAEGDDGRRNGEPGTAPSAAGRRWPGGPPRHREGEPAGPAPRGERAGSRSAGTPRRPAWSGRRTWGGVGRRRGDASGPTSPRLTRTWGRAARAGLTAYEVGWGSERSGAVRASGARARASTRNGPRTGIASCSRRRTQCWRNRQPRSQ